MDENDLTNRQFGDYHILRRIGGGAMAEVYLAEQRSLGRRVALKILKPELAADETYLKRFVREARAIAQLVHPNLVQIYQADCIDGFWFIAQEYVSGQTLQQLVRRGGPLSAKRVADILWQVSAALDCAAESGVVHRDIKPDNILLGDNGDVKVADFGLARVIDSQEQSSLALTQVGMTLGTPLYMSPEQAQGKPLDHRSDMYSLGITCYFALNGQPPFHGDTALAVAIQHINQPPKSLETLRPDVPPPLVRIIHRMIEKEPKDRYQTFHDVQLELRSLYTVSLNDKEAESRLTDWNRFRMNRSDQQLLLTTEKLQRMMLKEKSLKKRKRFWSIGLFLLLALFGLAGFTLGYWHSASKPGLLREPDSSSVMPQPTVEEQWVYACLANTPEAWYAVIDHFPDEENTWGRKAKRQLIRFYFHQGERGNTLDSFPLFQEFAAFSDVDVGDQALGLAGLAWCFAENQDNMNIPLDYLRRLYELPVPYSDSLVMQILDAAHKAIQRKNNPSAS